MSMKIVVPLDGSKVGESAIPYVTGLCSRLQPAVQTEITLLYVIPDSLTPPVVDGYVLPDDLDLRDEVAKATHHRAVEYLETVAEQLRRSGVNCKPVVTVGHAPVEIVRVAEDVGADMIAMSTHGRTGITRWALGSTTDKVLHLESKIPVTIVRAHNGKP